MNFEIHVSFKLRKRTVRCNGVKLQKENWSGDVCLRITFIEMV